MENAVDRIILDKIRIGMETTIPKACIQDLKLEKVSDFIAGDITYRLHGFLLGKQNMGYVSYYSNWWQELRTKILPKWYLKKKPSTKEKITFDIIYPTLNYASETHSPVVMFNRTKHTEILLN